ncbi:MAG: hypothetical protein KF777_13590 [Planctomycetaceae bacterium]|nr:hypothetical protein [Planctomycetaceae bacterium]
MNADTATEQAQHKVANDAITDTDFNSALAREQAAGLSIAGQEFKAAAARRTNMFDHFGALLAARYTPPVTA